MVTQNQQQIIIGTGLVAVYGAALYPHSLEAIKTLVVTIIYILLNGSKPTLTQPIWYGSFAIDIYNTLLRKFEVHGICKIHHGKNCDVLIKSLINLIIIDIITLGISYRLNIKVPMLSTDASKSLHLILSGILVVFAIYVLIYYKLIE